MEPGRAPGRGGGTTTLDAPDRRAQLREGLESLRGEVAGLRGARESLGLLLSDDELAWQTFATSLLAEALADE